MAFSYTLPPASDRDRVRFLIADTTEDDHRVEDEEIDLTLAQTGSDIFFAAAMCCDFLSARFAAKGRRSVGALTIEYSQMASDYAARADSLREAGYNRPGTGAGVYVGGISKSDKDARKQDEDWEHTQVSIGFTDSKGTVYTAGTYPWQP